MPDYSAALSVVVQVLENGTYLAEAVLFPEFSCFRPSGGRIKADVRGLAEQVLKNLPAGELHFRHLPGQPEQGTIELAIEPVAGDKTWLGPWPLKFDVIRWEHPAEAFLGYVPALGIEIVAATAEAREERFEREIRAALLRRNLLASPLELVWLQRGRKFRVIAIDCLAARLGAKQGAIASEAARRPTQSVLRQVATDLTAEPLSPAYECDESLRKLADLLSAQEPSSVLLVGPSGVGKTAIVDELVRQRRKFGLGNRPFWRTSGARLVAGMSGFGMWEERCKEVCREAAKTRSVLHLGNLVELMEVGKSTCSLVGIAGFLRASIARSELLAIVECTPEQVAFIERTAPTLLTAFHQIAMSEPDAETTRRIVAQTCENFTFSVGPAPAPRRRRIRRKLSQTERPDQTGSEPDSGRNQRTQRVPQPIPKVYPVPVAPHAFEVLDRLHRRYATYSVSPGRQVRFMQNLLRDVATAQLAARAGADAETPLDPVTPADVIGAFGRETGLPIFLLDPAVPFDPQAARDWFNARVLGQQDVSELIGNLLATVKTALTRPGRPIASLLFIGPTGVGKTEMSKSLATYLFGSPDRLTRFDMSEFGDSISVTRLIGGVLGSEGLLTGKVREQPFSVLLFDEVEKSAPEFFDLLLQILGDGRLTDAAGRLADFRNTVIIMTSNLGAETYQQGNVGFTEARRSVSNSARHFENAVRGFVRPELFNRIDRIVPFAPLDEKTVLGIARLQLRQLLDRNGLKYRKIELNITDDVAQLVARLGFDPRYGARPVKRRIERELLAPLADRINAYAADQPLEASLRVHAGALQVTVRAATDMNRSVASEAEPAQRQLAAEAVDLRRQHQRLELSSAVVEIETELFRLNEWEQRLLQDATRKRNERIWQRPEVAAKLARLNVLRELAVEIRQTATAIVEFEEAGLCRLNGELQGQAPQSPEGFPEVRRQWEGLLLKLFTHQFSRPDLVTLAVYSEHSATLRKLASAYLEVARTARYLVELHRVTSLKISLKDVPIIRDKQSTPDLWRRLMEKPEEFLADEQPGVVGVVFVVRGPAVWPRFEPEAGLHEFTDPEQPRLCLVETNEGGISEYVPPIGIQRKGRISGTAIRRRFDHVQQVIYDKPLDTRFEWFGRDLAAILTEALENRLRQRAGSLLETLPSETEDD
jgi:ATP-dependent Clp protease ATP-binding subunit ClpA